MDVPKDEVYPDNEILDNSYENYESDLHYQNENSKFPCDICGFKFARLHNVKRHKEKVHGMDFSDGKPYFCDDSDLKEDVLSKPKSSFSERINYQNENPWLVENLNEFKYFCCPGISPLYALTRHTPSSSPLL